MGLPIYGFHQFEHSAQIRFFKDVKMDLTKRFTVGEKKLIINNKNSVQTIIKVLLNTKMLAVFDTHSLSKYM